MADVAENGKKRKRDHQFESIGGIEKYKYSDHFIVIEADF